MTDENIKIIYQGSSSKKVTEIEKAVQELFSEYNILGEGNAIASHDIFHQIKIEPERDDKITRNKITGIEATLKSNDNHQITAESVYPDKIFLRKNEGNCNYLILYKNSGEGK
jgi:hypothetical protein